MEFLLDALVISVAQVMMALSFFSREASVGPRMRAVSC